MRKLFLGVAIWNTLVMLVNVFLWPAILPPEALVYMTLPSQLLPICIPLAIWTLCASPQRFYL
jgi:hypothetical protein